MSRIETPQGGALRGASASDTKRILNDPTFQDLVRRRSSFGWTMSFVMLAVYLVFVFLVAFAKPVMAMTPLGGVTSLGIILGLLVIIFAFVMTGVYVSRANRVFDPLSAEIRRRVR